MKTERRTSPRKSTSVRKNLLKQILIVTLLISFTVLLVGGYWVYESMAPRPAKVISPAGDVITTAEQIKGGQAVYQKYGLMDYGSVLGHGSYLGPDYTSEALHIAVTAMQDYRAKQEYGKPFAQLEAAEKSLIKERVKEEIRVNRYDPDNDSLTLTDAQVHALEKVREHYRTVFTQGDGNGIPPGLIQEKHMPKTDRAWVAEGDQLTQIADFFFWTAWLSSTHRPGETHTFTNNWPYDEEAGNTMTFASIWWSAFSTALLVGFTALILYFYFRY